MDIHKRRVAIIASTFIFSLNLFTNNARAWDPQPTNPFPGVPFGGEIPGYTNTVPCQPSDCGIGIVPVIDCPPWSAADGGGGFEVGYAKRFCRNSWTPPTSAADDEDFRNRQQLAIAQATAESQAWNAAHPGEQKCVTWGPIVHANGISTASGGVCANVVGTKSDGTTSQTTPSQVGTIDQQTGNALPSSTKSKSTNSAGSEGSSNDSSSTKSDSSQSSTNVASSSDYSQYGLGKPFTQIIKGDSGSCPSGFTAASNSLSGTGLTECWPENAWAAYSVGGQTWTDFKSSNGSKTAQIAAEQQVQLNATRMLALQKAQSAANETPGIKRCFNWEAFGQTGQECAFIPIQNGNLGTESSIEQVGSDIPSATTNSSLENLSKTSSAGLSIAEWKNSTSYQNLKCPIGYEKSTTLDMKGTISIQDDIWNTECVKSKILESPESSNPLSNKPTSDTTIDSTNVQAKTNLNNNSNFNPSLDAVSLQLKGTGKELSSLASKIEENKQQIQQIQNVLTKVDQVASKSYSSTIKLPVSRILTELGTSLTPSVCSVVNNVITRITKGLCVVNYQLQGESGNSYTTTKQVQFK